MGLALGIATEQRLAHSRTQPLLPLVDRDPGTALANITSPLALLNGRLGEITAGEFLSQCMQIAERLPAQRHVLNLCANAYLFTLAFCAALIRGQTTLLPQNRTPETLRRLVAEYPSSYLLHDGQLEPAQGIDINQWRLADMADAASVATPHIPRNFPAAVAFTSGSTGQPKAIVKPWHTLVTSALMNGACMLPPTHKRIQQLATVPPQHMWGLETGLMIPLFWPVCVADSRPMFPAGIVSALQALPEPRLLVTTPVHLRALLGSGLAMPRCLRTLCATAPLAPELAATCEARSGGDLLEIYGCSEIGSTAHRRTAVEHHWRLIPGLVFRDVVEGEQTRVGGEHLPEDQLLQDRVEISAHGFRLMGRHEDMVNVGGKRGSLMEITQVLLEIPGITDAAVFIPETASHTGRPAALVVATEKSLRLIHEFFIRRLDAVFLPRPLYFVDHLPRENTGKLHRAKLLDLYRAIQNQATNPSQ